MVEAIATGDLVTMMVLLEVIVLDRLRGGVASLTVVGVAMVVGGPAASVSSSWPPVSWSLLDPVSLLYCVWAIAMSASRWRLFRGAEVLGGEGVDLESEDSGWFQPRGRNRSRFAWRNSNLF